MDFSIRYLDHVAIRVTDIEHSINWYKTVLGLKTFRIKEWGDYPVFMLAGKTGVAIFPKDIQGLPDNSVKKAIRIDHFAFNVDSENFAKAKNRFDVMGIPYRFSDHTLFHSLYLNDPDGHEVELTCLVVEEHKFYKND